MANIIKLGSILLDGTHTKPGSEYQPGQSICFADGDTLSWIVVNGLLIADRPLLVNISWDDLDAQGFAAGKEVWFSGQRFLCRLLRVGAERGAPNEWDSALDVVGEHDDLWHWHNTFCWGQECVKASDRAYRGYGSARSWYNDSPRNRYAHLGFRPALAPLPSDNLISGIEACAIAGQSIIRGKLLEVTHYDAIIQPEPGSMMAEADICKLYAKRVDGTTIIDRTHMVVQVIKEK